MAQLQRSRGSWIAVLAALGLCGALVWWSTAGEGDAPAVVGSAEVVALAGGVGPRDRPGPADDRPFGLAGVAGTVRDPRGRPVAAASVCAFPGSPRLTRADAAPRCVASRRDGRYRIDALFPARHRVSAAAPGFVPVWYGRGEGAARREAIDLRVGAVATDVDLTLEAGGAQVRGVVRDLSGGAVEGARVSGGGLAAGMGVAITSSGADGEFSLWLRPGRARVWADADGYTQGADEGAAPGHHFELFLTPESVIVGKVVRAGDGSPVAGATVSVESGAGTHFLGSGGAAVSDAGGEFRVDGLAPGAYKARAEADDGFGLAAEQVVLGLGETSAPIVIAAHPAFLVEGHVVVAGTGDVCDNGSLALVDRAHRRERDAEVEADGLVRVRGLLPGSYEPTVHCPGHVVGDRHPPIVITDASVTGRRWQVTRGRAIRGIVVDARGQPAPRVDVAARRKPDPARPRDPVAGAWGTRSDAAGRFELAGMLPGEHEVTLSAWSSPRALPTAPIAVHVPDGRDVDDLRIELPAAGAVRGSVRDERGQPVARAQLRLFSGRLGQTAAVADDGSFQFLDVAPGEYRLLASRGGARLRSPGTGDDDAQGVQLEVHAGAVETVQLVVEAPAGRITGVVRDEGGAPLADAFIEASREPESAAAAAGEAVGARWRGLLDRPRLTDPDGRFVVDGLVPGRYSVRAQRRGGGEALLEHVAPGGGDVVLTIAATARLAGTVTLVGGGAPAEFSAQVHDRRTHDVRTGDFLRTGGAWSFAELPAGSYELQITAPEGSHTRSVALAAGEARTDVAVELVGRVTVRGTIVDLAGAPVAGVAVRISGDGVSLAEDDGRHVSDDAGRFEVTQVAVGHAELTADPRDPGSHARVHTTLEIAGGRPEVELPPIRLAPGRDLPPGAAGDLGYTLRRRAPGADPQQRQLVAVVRPGGPAAAAGLAVGDEIVAVDGQAVTGEAAYLHAGLTLVPVGAVVRLGLARGVTLAVTAGSRP